MGPPPADDFHGIGRIERLLTDNAWAYRFSLRTLRTEHARHPRT